MKKTILFPLLFLSIAKIFVTDGWLISSSFLEQCTNDGELDCETKIVVSLSVDGGQDENEALLFVNEVEDGFSGEKKEIVHPIRISVSKTDPEIVFPVWFVSRVNNKPFESVVLRDLWFDSCVDSSSSSSPTCGWYFQNGNKVEDSQGFCCECGFGDIFDDETTRAGHVCSLFGSNSASASCLRFDDLWYSVMGVNLGETSYLISLSIQQFDENIQAIVSETLSLSPQQLSSVSTLGNVSSRLLGDFSPFTQILDLTSKYLLIPSHPPNHPRVLEGVENWMFVDRHLVEQDGSVCNKIGVSFEAFRHEANKCDKSVGSCLRNQPEDFHLEDVALRDAGQVGSYFVNNFGSFSTSDQEKLTMRVPGVLSSVITISINADNVQYIQNVSPGVILDILLTSFEGFSLNGRMDIHVENTGSVVASYSLSFVCSEKINPISSKATTITPGILKWVNVSIYANSEEFEEHTCNVTLSNSEGISVDSKVVHFNSTITDTGLVFDLVGGEEPSSPGPGNGGSDLSPCDVCGSLNISCQLSEGCYNWILELILLVVLVLVLLYLLFRCLKSFFSRCCCGCCSGLCWFCTCCCANKKKEKKRKAKEKRGRRNDEERLTVDSDDGYLSPPHFNQQNQSQFYQPQLQLDQPQIFTSQELDQFAIEKTPLFFNVFVVAEDDLNEFEDFPGSQFSVFGNLARDASPSTPTYSFVLPGDYQLQTKKYNHKKGRFEILKERASLPAKFLETSNLGIADIFSFISRSPRFEVLNL